nr:AbrB/MazE/SpoVT family DNA-binding domain-containing protein [Sediminivirga luteola]
MTGGPVRLNSKGQVTIPANLRRQFGFVEGDEVDVVAEDGQLRIVHREAGKSTGARIVGKMRGRATTEMTTDELMDLLRGD